MAKRGEKKLTMADVQATGAPKESAVIPRAWTPDSAVDPSVKLVDLVGAMFPGEELVKCKAIHRHPNNPERVLAESYMHEGTVQPVYGLPFRVGKYARVEDDKGQPTSMIRGGTAPLTGYVPASLWSDARFERIETTDDDGEP